MFGKYISLGIYVRGHTYPGETHITITPDLRVAILGSVQSMGFDSPTENQTSAIEIFVRGHDVFIFPANG